MRLRNIPGAKDAILDCEWVIDEPERFKGKWNEVFGVKRPLFLEVGMGKGRFLMDMARLGIPCTWRISLLDGLYAG